MTRHVCENNPGYSPGFFVVRGETEKPTREVAAYLLDARSGSLAGVPQRHWPHLPRWNYAYAADGSGEDRELPVYVPHDGVAEDCSSTFDVARLQAIAALDVRCLAPTGSGEPTRPSNKKKAISWCPSTTASACPRC